MLCLRQAPIMDTGAEPLDLPRDLRVSPPELQKGKETFTSPTLLGGDFRIHRWPSALSAQHTVGQVRPAQNCVQRLDLSSDQECGRVEQGARGAWMCDQGRQTETQNSIPSNRLCCTVSNTCGSFWSDLSNCFSNLG